MEENNNENNQNTNENTISLEQYNEVLSQVENLTSRLNEKEELFNKVSGKKDEILNELKNAKGQLNQFKQAAQDEEEKSLFGQGEEGFKIILDNRVKAAREEDQSLIQRLNAEKEDLLSQIQQRDDKLLRNEFSNKFLSILPQTEIAETAYEDVIELAMKSSEIRDGKIVFRDKYGNVQTTNSQNKEYSEFDFINSLKHKKHLFKQQQGTNNRQGNFSGSGIEMTKKEAQDAQRGMNSQQKAEFREKIRTNKIIIN